ncbi:hypothetical protein [Parvularcula maris]|uniref:Uncharacterized protein n=1 Tax=Parvularcula maris TaxID=2965077 RepID=A0A9X2L9P7_9PROT|nr:hypothetical protein [Parvularcula maris]MCQ8185665.1 hypothetical protein [Parvularcula maris]
MRRLTVHAWDDYTLTGIPTLKVLDPTKIIASGRVAREMRLQLPEETTSIRVRCDGEVSNILSDLPANDIAIAVRRRTMEELKDDQEPDLAPDGALLAGGLIGAVIGIIWSTLVLGLRLADGRRPLVGRRTNGQDDGLVLTLVEPA